MNWDYYRYDAVEGRYYWVGQFEARGLGAGGHLSFQEAIARGEVTVEPGPYLLTSVMGKSPMYPVVVEEPPRPKLSVRRVTP